MATERAGALLITGSRTWTNVVTIEDRNLEIIIGIVTVVWSQHRPFEIGEDRNSAVFFGAMPRSPAAEDVERACQFW